MNLRILTVLGGGSVGGAEAFFVSLTTAFKRAGIDVRAVLKPSRHHETDLKAAGVEYHLARFGGGWDIFTPGKIMAVAEVFRPDVVLGFAGRANARIPHGPYVHVGRLGGYYKLKYFRGCDHLICNAPSVLRHIIEGGWPEQRVSLIPNFPNLAEGRPIVRQNFDTPEDVPLALALGRLHPNKAFDTLLRATTKLPNLWLWIAGEGSERTSLESLARELGISERVKFLGWRNDRADLFKTADICVYPSRQEPFGNVVVEAWGYGVPLVTTASEGPAWLARNGKDAIVVPVDNPDALAESISRVLSSPNLAAGLAENGRRRIAEEFSEAGIVQRYIDLFQELRR